MKKYKSAFEIIVIAGMLRFGLRSAITFIILFPAIFWLYMKLFSDPISYLDLLVGTATWAFILFPVGGLVWGIIMWSIFGEKPEEAT